MGPVINPSLLSADIHCKFQELINVSDPLPVKSGKLKINLNQLPYFADHSIQDMIVLPGSAYIELVLSIYARLFGKIPNKLSNVLFGNLTLLSDQDTILNFEISGSDHGKTLIEFFEYSPVNSNKISRTQFKVEDVSKTPGFLKKTDFAEFTRKADTVINGEDFYQRLWINGNQYGKEFRNVSKIWVNGNEAAARLIFSMADKISDKPFLLDPIKLDSVTHVLSALNFQSGKSFILTSIAEINIVRSELPDELWCSAELVEYDINGFSGDLKVFDKQGNLHLLLIGLRFKYLDYVQQKPVESAEKICISSSFTADPVEDSLKFWNSFFNTSYEVQFTPYNQIFQELLNPKSMLSLNTRGFNVILLGLEDWTRKENQLLPLISDTEMNIIFQNKSRYTLPNRMEIVQLNKYETEYVYKEIFVDKCYLKNGIELNDGDTIIDIGANIGLFTLFVNQQCKDPVVYSFEPSPVVYDLLKLNSQVYGSRIKTFNCGVSDKSKTATFTFYEKSSVFSSFNPDEAEDRDAVKAVVRNILTNVSSGDGNNLEQYVEEMTGDRLEKKQYECRLLSVSDIIRENKIEVIDLLKIDAEKSELDIVRGIGEADWKKIRQIVIEIHDKSGNVLEQIESFLHKQGFSCIVEEEKMLKDSGLFNVFAKRISLPENQKKAADKINWREEKLRENMETFIKALNAFKSRNSVPLLVSFTPASPKVSSNSELSSMYNYYEQELSRKLEEFPNIFTVTSSVLKEKYPVAEYYDSLGDELGHIPYTLPFFTSIGTVLFRLILSIQSPPKKVIALDCDNTIWEGICGEDGPKGIRITEPYKILQQFLIEQIESGMLICLCSKNNEEDVMQVFDERSDMILKREHLVSWRTNWKDKSENLVSLSKELNLGLHSFIFIDDNPVECASVKSRCPEVLTLQLPEEQEVIPGFLNNIWVFDHTKITDEDKKRTNYYKENIHREKQLSTAITLKDFLDKLDLQIKIFSPDKEQMDRVSQLTFRTNQFNFSTKRRSVQEIINFLGTGNNNLLVADVSDRFGHYGLVGAVMYSRHEDSFKVDTLLLSCRVLGRGVEYKILSELGKRATEAGVSKIEINYVPSPKNKPALNFINKIGLQYRIDNSEELIFKLPAEYLRNLKYEDYIEQASEEDQAELRPKNKKIKGYYGIDSKIQIIADQLNNVHSIYRKVEEFKTAGENSVKEILLAETDLEKKIAEVWQKVLGRTEIGMDQNFLDTGGTSLKAIQLIAAIKKDLKLNISLVDVFECPSIRLLAQKFNPSKEDAADSDSGLERGSRRRNSGTVRKRGNINKL